MEPCHRIYSGPTSRNQKQGTVRLGSQWACESEIRACKVTKIEIDKEDQIARMNIKNTQNTLKMLRIRKYEDI